MKRNKLKKITRILLVVCGIVLLVVLFVPMWNIDLSAPQYPEGLTLMIYPDHLGGNVDIINGLNHYIGMKTLHTADFFEFTILPYIIVFFSLLLLATALIGSRRFFYVAVSLFVCFGVIAMVDFWRWEYNYGHNLNPDAAIVVPGMAYQPPLIGYKQLLNFSAYSFPATGGWIFAGVGGLLVLLVVVEWVTLKKRKARLKPITAAAAAMLFITLMSSCTKGPEPIVAGKDQCDFCKMTVSDSRFGAELITKKGKIYKFDDAHCLLSFLQQSSVDHKQVKQIYFTNFSGNHSLIPSANSLLLKSADLRSPMGGNIAAFDNKDSLDKMITVYNGVTVQWSELYKNE